MRRVVITGIGIVAPNGIGRKSFSEAIVEGRSGVGPIESFDTTGQVVKIAGEVKNFDVLPYLGDQRKTCEAHEPRCGVCRRRGRPGSRGFGDRSEPARSGAIRRDHGNWHHADGYRRTRRSDRPCRRGRWHARPRQVQRRAGGVDFSALAAPTSPEHGRRAHFHPASRDGSEQHDRDRLRGGNSGRRGGVPSDLKGRHGRDARRRLRQPARPTPAGRLSGDECRQPLNPDPVGGLATVRR